MSQRCDACVRAAVESASGADQIQAALYAVTLDDTQSMLCEAHTRGAAEAAEAVGKTVRIQPLADWSAAARRAADALEGKAPPAPAPSSSASDRELWLRIIELERLLVRYEIALHAVRKYLDEIPSSAEAATHARIVLDATGID